MTVAFLAIPVGLVFVGVLIVWLRNREISGPNASIDAFARERRAIAPDDVVEHTDHRS